MTRRPWNKRISPAQRRAEKSAAEVRHAQAVEESADARSEGLLRALQEFAEMSERWHRGEK